MRTVLVADDSNVFREPIVTALRSVGYRVLAVDDGQAALELMLEDTVDLAVLDVVMPGLDGLELMRAMRADCLLAETPVILLTALCEMEYLVEAEQLGCRKCLAKKDFSFGQLTASVERALSDAGARGPSYSGPRQATANYRFRPRPLPRP